MVSFAMRFVVYLLGHGIVHRTALSRKFGSPCYIYRSNRRSSVKLDLFCLFVSKLLLYFFFVHGMYLVYSSRPAWDYPYWALLFIPPLPNQCLGLRNSYSSGTKFFKCSETMVGAPL